jgi:diketogulonate reductase-like aldo/keto reductase
MSLDSITLKNGVKIPMIGLGTTSSGKDINPDDYINDIKYAIQIGYRHFDTAKRYGTEKYIGEALKVKAFKY